MFFFLHFHLINDRKVDCQDRKKHLTLYLFKGVVCHLEKSSFAILLKSQMSLCIQYVVSLALH